MPRNAVLKAEQQQSETISVAILEAFLMNGLGDTTHVQLYVVIFLYIQNEGLFV
ncbi:hypothetical protein GCM10011396_46120 [Undibacterium terreum]|uniref:Uncharacterized protein n=1 Tax=Undibacterium terreum TaxID=1224302 RepID=A0A916UZV6_9BURK|nr:hypothetical protein GCM10011396_46120 [Undibacterium terreum]